MPRCSCTWIDTGEGTLESALDLLDLDDALRRLEGLDGELFHIVELRFFGGLSHAEIARAWLHAELR